MKHLKIPSSKHDLSRGSWGTDPQPVGADLLQGLGASPTFSRPAWQSSWHMWRCPSEGPFVLQLWHLLMLTRTFHFESKPQRRTSPWLFWCHTLTLVLLRNGFSFHKITILSTSVTWSALISRGPAKAFHSQSTGSSRAAPSRLGAGAQRPRVWHGDTAESGLFSCNNVPVSHWHKVIANLKTWGRNNRLK